MRCPRKARLEQFVPVARLEAVHVRPGVARAPDGPGVGQAPPACVAHVRRRPVNVMNRGHFLEVGPA